ncbi:MAG: 3-oxoacyl-[acyl-carrier-protein] reductase FabG [Alphaproteobacteria bacterium MarineAlpha2_Bin1]|nr:MAG: 3-oxoacyl-[acyl-carrier-protein] reductase FabG [Alphaproteobacteria bacterium MarineAlpha2_Bin1]
MAISKKNPPLALVTGAGIGIGEATSVTLGKLGYRVIVTDILEKEGKAVARKINRSGKADFYNMDVASTDNVNSVIADVEKKYRKPFEVIINNAGIAKTMPMRGLKDKDWDWIHEVDLKGMMRVCRAAAPKMRKSKRGSIVCLSSIAGYAVGWDKHVPYSAAKGGIAGFVKGLAVELAADKIRVNGIAPGLIWTAQALDPIHSMGPKLLRAAASGVPLKRIGTAQDIADTVSFLISDRASYLTGQVITVDGGLTVAL